MTPLKRVFLLVVILAATGLLIELTTLGLLYDTAFQEQRNRLEGLVKSQARIIEAVTRFDRQYSNDYPEGARQATLFQIIEAHRHSDSDHRAVTFSLAQKNGARMEFLLIHDQEGLKKSPSLPFYSEQAEPMRLALLGEAGSIISRNGQGQKILAAYEAVKPLNIGLVAQINLAEIRRPFYRAGLISALIGQLAVALGAILFLKVTEPLLARLAVTVQGLQKALAQVKMLSGLVPICASCKRVRDDKGYWNQIEAYIQKNSEVQFSHGMCPDCAHRAYRDFELLTNEEEGAPRPPAVHGQSITQQKIPSSEKE